MNIPAEVVDKNEDTHLRNSMLISSLNIISLMRQGIDYESLGENMMNLTQLLNSTTDNKPIEEMLLYQTYVLQAIFERAAENLHAFQFRPEHQSWGAIALKAQDQIRKTLATLADVRNPKRIAFIKQQTNAMQVNVNTKTPKIEKSANELIKEEAYATLDDKRTSSTITINSASEALEEVHRANDEER
ncbi:MAG: hypothetical protein ACYCQI_02980 [Gammaproteobacteria bacterium]